MKQFVALVILILLLIFVVNFCKCTQTSSHEQVTEKSYPNENIPDKSVGISIKNILKPRNSCKSGYEFVANRCRKII